MQASNLWVLSAVAALALAGCGSNPQGDTLDDEDFDGLGLEAEADKGILRGIVIDERITPLADATVTAICAEAAGNVTMVTKEDGIFGFDQLDPGTCFITASKLGYKSIQTSFDVVAGDNDPKPVKMMLVADPASGPRIEDYHLDGYMTCSVRPMFFGLQCGFLADNDIVNGEYDMSARPDWIQSEMVWESTQPIGEEMSLALRCLSGGDPAGKCPDGTLNIVSAEGFAPLTATINRTVAETWALGGEGGNPLHVNLFAFGRTQLDPWDEETINSAQKPATGNDCMEWGTVGQIVFGFDPTACMRATGPGLVINQKVDVYTNIFYGFTPDEGWNFGADGPHALPPT